MPRSLIRRLVLAAFLGLLVAPWSAAAATRSHFPKRSQTSKATPLSVLLGSLFGFMPKIGCGIDPDGLLTPPADAGCGLDPNGRCATATTEIGCGIDPNGCAGEN
jgi:hypothetical protein